MFTPIDSYIRERRGSGVGRRTLDPGSNPVNNDKRNSAETKRKKKRVIVDVFILDMLMNNAHDDVVYLGKPTHCHPSI